MLGGVNGSDGADTPAVTVLAAPTTVAVVAQAESPYTRKVTVPVAVLPPGPPIVARSVTVVPRGTVML